MRAIVACFDDACKRELRERATTWFHPRIVDSIFAMFDGIMSCHRVATALYFAVQRVERFEHAPP